jgi:hypothetical protein
METATMTTPSFPPSLIGETKATESDIDAYANRVLETMSPLDKSSIDDSLGPYVTSLLRCADIQHKSQVKELLEFDSLLELLEDQCNIDKKTASDCIILIVDAVVTSVLPFSERTITTTTTTTNGPSGLYAGGGLDSFQSMKSHLPDTTAFTATITGENTDSSVGGPSPLKPDNLIPIDLMGVLDDPSPNHADELRRHDSSQIQQQEQVYQFQMPSQTNFQQQMLNQQQYSQLRDEHDAIKQSSRTDEDFPPLGASTEKPKKIKIGGSKKSSHGKTQQHSDKDLAATLFRPARPRQNSIESEEASSHQQRSRGSSIASTTMTSNFDDGGSGGGGNNNIFFQQQLNSCVEILLSMNQDLSEEAAYQAGLMANTDFNLAQHIIDSALTAPPICRHMLSDGCYRSDCTFSHDVDGHTCLFWVRGRCGKGSTCKFFHGFNEKLLNRIDTSTVTTTSQYYSTSNAVSSHATTQNNNMATSSRYPPYSYPSPSCPSSASGPSSMNGFGNPSPLPPSTWQRPDSSTETSFSFANIASKVYEKNKFSGAPSPTLSSNKLSGYPTVRIPQDLWNPHENRDPTVFYVAEPLERYRQVNTSVQRSDVIDLHFQSTKTFHVVLSVILPLKLNEMNQVWIVTGTGHHVGTKTHQKGGGALEQAVIQWLIDEKYDFTRGKDRNGLGGALLVNR